MQGRGLIFYRKDPTLMNFMIIDTCEIIMNNHTREIIDFTSAETSISNSLIIHKIKTEEINTGDGVWICDETLA